MRHDSLFAGSAGVSVTVYLVRRFLVGARLIRTPIADELYLTLNVYLGLVCIVLGLTIWFNDPPKEESKNVEA